MRMLLLLSFLVASVTAWSQANSQDPKTLLHSAHKLIVVKTVGWNGIAGEMQRYERHGHEWKKTGKPITIVVGKNGIAWDDHFPLRTVDASAPIKHEGDGRSPAGVFRITRTFGFAPELGNNKFYLPLTPTTECVDDVHSKYYNQIVDRMNVKDVDWNSSEKMRDVPGYQVGAAVAYNASHTPGRGSCIFLHIWSAPTNGTAGCTAMSEENAQEVMRWLDAKTVLAQMPAAEYEKVKGQLSLP